MPVNTPIEIRKVDVLNPVYNIETVEGAVVASSAVATHNADTTGVHGIADTGNLVTVTTTNALDNRLDAIEDPQWSTINGVSVTDPERLNQHMYRRFVNIPNQGALSTKISIMKISRDTLNWAQGVPIEVIVRNKYYESGIVHGVIGGAAWGHEPYMELISSMGTYPVRPYVSTETTVTGNIKEAEIYVNVPDWMEVVVEIRYGARAEVGVSTAFSTGGQFKWSFGTTNLGNIGNAWVWNGGTKPFCAVLGTAQSVPFNSVTTYNFTS